MMTEVVEAVNTAVVALARTETEEGMEKTLAMAPERVTETPPEGAGLDIVTVQEVLALEARVEAVHCSEETSVGAVRETLKGAEEPLREAVMVTV